MNDDPNDWEFPFADGDDPDDGMAQDPEDEFSCDNCGPWCDDWMGDGLCRVDIEEYARQAEDYKKRHTRVAECPICHQELPEHDVLGVKELWVWKPAFYDARIAIFDVYGALWLKKGEVHHHGNMYHIWVEWGDGRKESLVRLMPDATPSDGALDHMAQEVEQ